VRQTGQATTVSILVLFSFLIVPSAARVFAEETMKPGEQSAAESLSPKALEAYGSLLPEIDELVPALTTRQLADAREYVERLSKNEDDFLQSALESERAYFERISQEGTRAPDAVDVSSDNPSEAGDATPANVSPTIPLAVEPIEEFETVLPIDGPATAPLHLGTSAGSLDAPERDRLVVDGARRFAKGIVDGSTRYDLRPSFVLCIMKLESDYKGDAVSHAGAIGLMQLMPATAEGLNVNPYDIYDNILGGCRMIDDLLREFSEDIALAMAAYNAGPTRVRQYNGIPPFEETQRYVRRIVNECGAARP